MSRSSYFPIFSFCTFLLGSSFAICAQAASPKTCEILFSKSKTPAPATRIEKTGEPKTLDAAARNLSGVLNGKLTSKEDIKEAVKTVLQIADADSGASETISLVRGETHSLYDFLNSDPEKNLAVRAPLNVLNAAQRMLALVYSQGVKRVRMPITGAPVDLYAYFSGGTDVTDRYRIVGQENIIEQFVKNMRAQARGDRSGVAPLLLVGSHGTGKSETLKLLQRGAENLTTRIDNGYAIHTFSWTRLEEIPSMQDFYSPRLGSNKLPEVPAPMGDSPFVILPEPYQRAVLQMAHGAASKLIDGTEPVPFTRADRVSNFIRNEIVQHYSQLRGRPLSNQEILKVLNDHIIVKRRLLGKTYNSMPLIGVQSQDLDIAGLFMSPNPLVRLVMGANHDMAWNYNGKMLSGQGNAILLDEILRSPKEFINMMLNGLESRELEVGGSPQVPFDAVIVAATNTANLNELRADGKSHAALDRFFKMPMRWTLLPHEAAQTLLNGKIRDMSQKPLNDATAAVVRANIDDLFPRMEGLERIKTPDHRYQYWFRGDKHQIAGSPHVLLFMSEIVAASRYELDPAKVTKVKSGKIAGSQYLRSPIERLRLYEGERLTIESDELRDLLEVSSLLKEGETGISARNAGLWLTEAISLAEASGSNTLTPGLVLRAFKKLLNDETIEWPSHSERLRWMDLAREITSEMLIPRIESDITSALAHGDRAVRDAYFDMLDEMYALHNTNGKAISYMTSSGLDQPIDIQRLRRVEEIYLKKNGIPLNYSQIAIFHSRQKGAENLATKVPDDQLLDAVAAYYAELNTRLVGLSKIVEHMRFGNGGDEVEAARNSLASAMKAMGYNDASLYDALMLISDPATRNRKSEN